MLRRTTARTPPFPRPPKEESQEQHALNQTPRPTIESGRMKAPTLFRPWESRRTVFRPWERLVVEVPAAVVFRPVNSSTPIGVTRLKPAPSFSGPPPASAGGCQSPLFVFGRASPLCSRRRSNDSGYISSRQASPPSASTDVHLLPQTSRPPDVKDVTVVASVSASSPLGKLPSGQFTAATRRILARWYDDHIQHPVPNVDELQELATAACVTVQQTRKYFNNLRERTKKRKDCGGGIVEEIAPTVSTSVIVDVSAKFSPKQTIGSFGYRSRWWDLAQFQSPLYVF